MKQLTTWRTAVEKLPEQGQWTYEDWLDLPDDGYRYEVIDGELHVSPPPNFGHQNAISNLLMRMRLYAQENDLGDVVTSPVGVRLPHQPVPLQPDIVFIRKERADIIEDTIEGAPDLIVEVLSPSNWVYDRREKQEAYQKAGVPEYWLVDYREETVELLVLEEETYRLAEKYSRGDEVASTVLEGFTILVDDIFRR